MKAVLSLSGGLDSSTLLAQFKNDVEMCVFVDYGSKQNDREFVAARAVADAYDKKLIKLELAQAFKSFNSALLKHSKEKIEKGPYGDKEVSNAKVPFRNGIFASLLVGIAESFDCDTVLLGVHAGDHKLYPDCTPKFVKAFGKAVEEYSDCSIHVEAPYINLTKGEIAQRAIRFGLPINLTYSCYNGGMEHCGECPTCIERREALGLFENSPGWFM